MDNNRMNPITNNGYDYSFFFANALANEMLDLQMRHIFPISEIETTLHNSLNDKTCIKHVISEDEKKKLIPVKFKNIESKDENTKCSITQEEFQDEDEIIQLPCSHCFNTEAIISWLAKEKGECPVCRYKFECVEIKDEIPIPTQETENTNSNTNANSNANSNYQNENITTNISSFYNDLFILPNYLINEPLRRNSGEAYFNFFNVDYERDYEEDVDI